MVGAHTDSPCLRIKPVSKRQADGFLQVGVEKYGGGLWHTWFDRDLSIAGRAMVRTEDGKFEMRLVKIDRPILRIPTLAVHLDRQEKFEFNIETQLYPIAGLVAAELNRQGKTDEKEVAEKLEDTKLEEKEFHPLNVASERHHPYIVELIAEEAGCASNDVIDFEMVLYDTQKSCLGGLNNELIFSARLDNLCMSFCALHGLLSSLHFPSTLKDESTIRLIALFDHEEIGSLTAQGADSNLLPAVLKRLSLIPSSSQTHNGERTSESSYETVNNENPIAFEQTLSRSFLVSADMGHSVHPNYGHKYEQQHRPEMNGGVVIKVNANARYTTNSPGIVLLQECARTAKTPPSPSNVEGEAREEGVPLQLFVVRNDSSCGSTIGPMLSAALGARTIDVGNATLSMHSIRETTGAHDVGNAVALFESFFERFGELEEKIVVD